MVYNANCFFFFLSWGNVPGAEDVQRYIQDYAIYWKINYNIVIGAEIQKLERRIGFGDWKITVKRPDGTIREELHDLIVVACKDHELPVRPSYVQDTEFEVRRVPQNFSIHHSQFREAKFKRALRVHFLTHFTKTFCRFFTPKVKSGTDYDQPINRKL